MRSSATRCRLDLNTLKALKRCSLGLDLYLWLAYRTFALNRPVRITWRQLYCQFGVDPTKANGHRPVQDFRRKVLRELKKIKIAWPELHYSTAKGVLILERLFNANVRLIYEDEYRKQFIASNIADRGELWWDPKQPGEQMLWDSKIELGEKFFNEITRHPVPLDMNILKALKRCSLGLDLYLWAAYRTFSLKHPLRLSWPHLYRQFGVAPAKANDHRTVQDFRRKVLRELKKIKTAWPGLKYATAKGVLVLYPSTPSIPPGQHLSLVK